MPATHAFPSLPIISHAMKAISSFSSLREISTGHRCYHVFFYIRSIWPFRHFISSCALLRHKITRAIVTGHTIFASGLPTRCFDISSPIDISFRVRGYCDKNIRRQLRRHRHHSADSHREDTFLAFIITPFFRDIVKHWYFDAMPSADFRRRRFHLHYAKFCHHSPVAVILIFTNN